MRTDHRVRIYRYGLDWIFGRNGNDGVDRGAGGPADRTGGEETGSVEHHAPVLFQQANQGPTVA